MEKILETWKKIKKGNIAYEAPSESYSECELYISQDYVFKRAPDELKDKLWMSKNTIDMLHSYGVNVPEVVFTLEDDNLVVYERINGEEIGSVGSPKYAKKLGSEIHKIHNNTAKRFGGVRFDKDKVPDGDTDTVQEYIQSSVEECERYTPDNSTYRELFERLQKNPPNTNLSVKPRLCHLDIDMKNVLCTGKNCYIIDFMGAEFSLPAMDIVHFYMKALHNDKSDRFMSAFLDGYGKTIEELPQYALKLAVLRELSVMSYWETYLSDANRFNHESCQQTIQEFIDQYIEV